MRAYAAHRDRLLVVDGVGVGAEAAAAGSPTVREALLGRDVEAVAAHPADPDRAFVGTFDDGLHVTRDGGRSFERVASPAEAAGDAIEQDAVTAVAVAPTDPGTIWVGTEPSRVYRWTEDGGRPDARRSVERLDGLLDVPSADQWSFPPRPDTHHVRWVEPDQTDERRLYVGIEAGALVYTPDSGATWVDRPPGSRRDNHQLASHPDAPGRVYAAAGDGYAESTDGGEHWTARHDGLAHRYVWSVLPDPGDPDRVLVSAASGPGSAHSPPGESYCYRRSGDESWQRLAGPLSGEGAMRAVLSGDGEPGHAYALNNRGLYASADFGDTWSRVDVPWPGTLREQTARGLAVVPE